MCTSQKYPQFIPHTPESLDRLSAKPHQHLAEVIREQIRNNKIQNVIIGLEGERGSGKSNLINLIQASEKDDNIYFLYDLWSYQADLSNRNFIEELYKFLKVDMGINCNSINPQQCFSSSKVTKSTTKTRLNLQSVLFYAALTTFFPAISLAFSFHEKFKFPIFLPIVVIVVYSLLFHSALTKRKANNRNSLRHVIKVITEVVANRSPKAEIQENIYESKAGVRQLEQFLQAVGKGLDDERSGSKLIIIFDNIDRLEADKIREAWNLIHTISAITPNSNIAYLIPYDKKYISCTGMQDEKECSSYIEKTFSCVFTVPEPIIIDRNKIFKDLYSRAFGNTDENYDATRAYFNEVHPRATIRQMIQFLNVMVAMHAQCRNNEVRISSIALFVLCKDAISQDPIKKLSGGSFLSEVGIANPYKNDINSINNDEDDSNSNQIDINDNETVDTKSEKENRSKSSEKQNFNFYITAAENVEEVYANNEKKKILQYDPKHFNSGLSRIVDYEGDSSLLVELTSLYYGVDNKNAEQLSIKNKIETIIEKGYDYDLVNNLTKDPQFINVLVLYIDNVQAQYLDKIISFAEKIFSNSLPVSTAVWEAIAKRKLKIPCFFADDTDKTDTLLLRLSPNTEYQEKLINKTKDTYQNIANKEPELYYKAANKLATLQRDNPKLPQQKCCTDISDEYAIHLYVAVADSDMRDYVSNYPDIIAFSKKRIHMILDNMHYRSEGSSFYNTKYDIGFFCTIAQTSNIKVCTEIKNTILLILTKITKYRPIYNSYTDWLYVYKQFAKNEDIKQELKRHHSIVNNFNIFKNILIIKLYKLQELEEMNRLNEKNREISIQGCIDLLCIIKSDINAIISPSSWIANKDFDLFDFLKTSGRKLLSENNSLRKSLQHPIKYFLSVMEDYIDEPSMYFISKKTEDCYVSRKVIVYLNAHKKIGS